MNKKEYQELKKLAEELSRELKNNDLSYEERKKLEPVADQMAGLLCSIWFPIDWRRRFIMLVFFIIGLVGFLFNNYWLLLSWGVAALFSPRLVAEALVLIGVFYRTMNQSENS